MQTIIINNKPKAAPAKDFNASNKLMQSFIVCFISIMFAGISSMLMSVYLPVVVKDILGNVSDEKMNTVSAYINSIFIFGSMFGGFAWGFICDKIGRKQSVILCTICYGLFTVLTAFSSSWLMIGAYRFITGFGVGGVLVTTNILIAELWSEKRRAIAVGIVSAAMPVGFIVAGAANNILSSWHEAFLAGAVPLATAFVGLFLLAEPASWQENKSSIKKQNTNTLFAPQYKNNLLKGSLIFGAMLIGLWAVFSWAPTWVESITHDAEKAKTLRGTTMMIMAVSGLAGSIVSGWIANAIGLRNTMLACFAACFLFTFLLFKLNTTVTTATFVEMGILAIFFGISQGALSVYIPALFPTNIKAFATGFCYNIGRLFTATVVFFIGALVSFLGGYGNAVFTFSFIFLIGFAFTFFSKKEDKNKQNKTALQTAFTD